MLRNPSSKGATIKSPSKAKGPWHMESASVHKSWHGKEWQVCETLRKPTTEHVTGRLFHSPPLDLFQGFLLHISPHLADSFHSRAKSNRLVRQKKSLPCAEVAQLAEHSPEKAGVDSSILSLGTIFSPKFISKHSYNISFLKYLILLVGTLLEPRNF